MEEDCKCNPIKEPIKAPLWLYVLLLLVGLGVNLYLIARSPDVNSEGEPVEPEQKLVAGIVITILYIVIGSFFGYWIYTEARKCNYGASWLVFMMSILIPVFLLILTTILLSVVFGMDMLNFG